MAEIRAQVDINVKQNGKTNSSKNGIKAKVQEQKAFNKEVKASGNLMDRFNKTLQSSSIAGWAALIKKTTDFLITAGKEQAGYVENLNLMQVAFGETAAAAENFTDNLTKAIGLDPNAMTRQLGVFRQLSSAMGYSAETANLLSYNLSKLQLDMASLYNLDFDQAGNALESAVTGRIQTIRSLTGVDITNAALQQFALANGIEESIHSMTRAEKALLIYLSLEEQLTNANGDLANTINSVSNQTKIFKEQISVAGRQLGAVFIPILKTILPLLNGILMAFNELVAMFLTLIGADASSLTDEFGTAGSGLNEIEDGLNGISTASKEAKKSLRGFDKLNNITTPSKGGGSGANTQINSKILDMLKEYNLHLDEMNNKATKIKENIMAWLGFSKNVNGEWEWSAGTLLKNIWEWWSKLNGVAKIFVTLGAVAVVKGLYDWFFKLAGVLKRTKLGASLGIIADTLGRKGLSGALKEINSVYGGFARFVEGLVGAVAIVDGVQGMADAIGDIVENGWSLEPVLEILLSFLEIISGIALVYGGIMNNTTAITYGLAGLAAALGGEYLVNLIAANEEEKVALTTTQEWNRELVTLEENARKAMESTNEQIGTIEALEGRLSDLVDTNGRLNDKNGQATTIISELNDLMGTNYEIIDGQVYLNGELIGTYDDLKKSIDDYCKSLRAEALVEAYREKYIATVKRQQKAIEEHDQVTKDLIESQKKYDLTTEEGHTKWVTENADKIKRLHELDKEIEKNSQNMTNYEKAAAEAINGNYEEASRLLAKKAEDVDISWNETIDSVIAKNDELTEDVKKTASEINNQRAYFTIEVNVDDEGFVIFQRKVANSSGIKIDAKANGGFVDTGQMFVAREKGPEMVGTIGGHTAVANNDQIVEAISVGVAKAMMATGGRNTTVNITAEGDASGLLNFINFQQKEKDRQFGLG